MNPDTPRRRTEPKRHASRLALSAFLAGLQALLMAPAASAADEHARRGVALYEQEDFEGAVEAFREAAKNNPEDAGVQYDLGTALAQKKDFSDAADVLNRTLSIQSETLPGRNVLYNLGYSQVMAAKERIEASQSMPGAPPNVAVSPSTGQTRPIMPGQITMPSGASPPGGMPGMGAGTGGGQVDPKELMEGLRQGMTSFRKAILEDPSDEDAKYNYETARMLLRQLEEQMQQQQQEQQQNGEGEQDEEQDQENQDQQDGDKQSDQNEQNQDQRQGDQKSEQEQQQKEGEKQDQKDGEQEEQESRSEESEEQEGKEQQKQDEGTPTPNPTPRSERNRPDMQPSQPENPQPLTPEQLDALRVLNSLEQDNPEQFKRLFQDQSARRRLERDW